MPTKEEIAKTKAAFVRSRQEALMLSTNDAEDFLIRQIFDEFFKEFEKSEGVILDKGLSIRLSEAVNKVFKNFSKNDNYKLVTELVDTFQRISTLNDKYFSYFRVRDVRLKAALNKANSEMISRIGITENGKLISGGWLDKMFRDKSLVKTIQKEVQKGNVNNLTVEKVFTRIKRTIIGDENNLGLVSHHYRTFAHDTIAQTDRSYSDTVAVEIGLNFAVYTGGTINTSRQFCENKNNRVFSRKEIEAWDKDPDLLLTKQEKKVGHPIDYNPFVDCGRWNCRHHLNWISDSEAKSRGRK